MFSGLQSPARAIDGPSVTGEHPIVRRWFLLSLVAIVSAVYLAVSVWALASGTLDAAGMVWALATLSLVAGGLLLVLRRPTHPIGQLLMLCGVAFPMLATIFEAPTQVVFRDSGAQEWMWASMLASQTSLMVALVLAVSLVVLLPDGRPRHARERRFLRVAWIVVILPAVTLVSNELVVTSESTFTGVRGITSPLVVSALRPFGPLFVALNTIAQAIFLVAIALLFLRYRTATGRERKQIRWVLFGGAVVLAVSVVPSILAGLGVIEISPALTLVSSLSIAVLPASVVVAVLEPPWIDVDIVIRRSVTYAALSVLILVTYIAAAALVGVTAGARLGLSVEVAVVLTVLIAILFQPARRRLQALADRWVFGARPTNYQAITEFGVTIDQTTEPSELLPRLVETIRSTLRVTWVTAKLDDGAHAEIGTVTGPPALRVPLGVGDEQGGEIVCGPKLEGRLGADDVQLVRTLAGQLALAVRNARLAGRIVDAAESERRRIEHNIHDGAQQELVALIAKLGIARSAATQGILGPEAIDDMRLEAQQILSELRELAQGIHPSVLSDGGIVEAVEDRCARLPLEVELQTSAGLRTRRFSDNVEGAAYFFVTESLANVLKHADAGRATISLTYDDSRLLLEVADDGRGFDTDNASDGGLAGLRDRVRALGGTVRITSRPGAGTRVTATLPVDPR